MEGYKIVRRIDGEMWSLLASIYSNNYRTAKACKYQAGVATTPDEGCGPLAVFDNKPDAVWSFNYNRHLFVSIELWECDYDPSREEFMWSKDRLSTMHIKETPKGTVFASSVTLTKRISD